MGWNIFSLIKNICVVIGTYLDRLLNKMNPVMINRSRVPNLFSTNNMYMYGFTFFPFIFLVDFENPPDDMEIIYKPEEIVNHETIHFQQVLETGIIGFYAIFLLEFIIKSIIYRDIKDGYRNISFEVEAYKYMKNMTYLENRKRYKWIKYILNSE